ncbi:flavin reductase family protein [Ancylobacter terrae]|uniref:flavin reductase family protein n=1 Tax=Ancylobacter sp. sgz301288 TaxID=3342077 RepID=UPI00385E12BE
MFYEPGHRDHALLPHNPLKAIISPRPIGWISTLSPAGIANLAPYSFFNMFSESPDIVGFASSGRKHSLANIEATGAFVYNLPTRELVEAVNLTSAPVPAQVSEFDLAGLERAPCRLVAPPRVAAAPCALECVYLETVELKGRDGASANSFLVLGEVVGIHIDDRFVENGQLRAERMHSLARGGYFDYSWVDEVLSIPRPR